MHREREITERLRKTEIDKETAIQRETVTGRQ